MQRALHVTRALLALTASSQHISDAQNLCGDGERVSMDGSGTAQCEACPNRYMDRNAAGDDTASGATSCDPNPDFRLSFDDVAAVCRTEMKACWTVDGCIDAVLPVLGVRGYQFLDGHLSVLSAEFVDLIVCAAQQGPAPPLLPPSPSAAGGTNTGDIDLHLGSLFPLTGAGCGVGWQAYFGTKLAVDMANCAAGKNYLNGMLYDPNKIGVLVSSTVCNPLFNIQLTAKNTDASVARAMFETDQLLYSGLDAIIGPLNNDVAMHVALLAEHEHVPVISYGAAMTKLSGMTATDDSHFARTFPSDKILLKGLVDFVQHRGWKGVTFLSTANEYGYDGAREWQSSIEELQDRMGITGDPTIQYNNIVLVDPNNPEDIRSHLAAIKEGEWRVVVCHAVGHEATKIMHEATFLRMTKLSWVWLGTEWVTDSFFLHKVEPHDGEVPCTQECEDTGLPAPDDTQCVTVCEEMNGEYMREELVGLVAVQVADHESPLSQAIDAEYTSGKVSTHTISAMKWGDSERLLVIRRSSRTPRCARRSSR